MKYRFTAEDFNHENLQLPPSYWKAIADHANALLKQWEKESEKVYGLVEMGHRYPYRNGFGVVKAPDDTHIAILWNPRKIGEKGEGE